MDNTDAPPLPVEDVIAFNANVSCDFFAVTLRNSNRYWKAEHQINIPQMELLRRACAVIEAVMKGELNAN